MNFIKPTPSSRKPPQAGDRRYATSRSSRRARIIFAEMVRQSMYERYQDEAYTRGFKVYTTLSRRTRMRPMPRCARASWSTTSATAIAAPKAISSCRRTCPRKHLEDALQEQSESDDIYPALVLDANAKAVKVYRKGGETIEISGDGLKFAQSMIGEKAPNNRRLRRGALIRVQQDEKGAVADHAAAAGRSGAGGDGSQRRCYPRVGRRLRLLPQQVQPRDAGLSPAGLQLQALHLFGGAGKGVHRRPPSSTMRRW